MMRATACVLSDTQPKLTPVVDRIPVVGSFTPGTGPVLAQQDERRLACDDA